MLQIAMLDGIANNADLCFQLQPNSRQWQKQAQLGGLTGVSTSRFGLPMPSIGGRPSAAMTMPMCDLLDRQLESVGVTGGMGVSEQLVGMQRRLHTAAIGTSAATYQGYDGNFNKSNNSGNHSRRVGWPPTSPGGGTAAS